MKVTLDVFSGRPNPSWELPDHDADSVVERFAARATPAALAAPPRLGYRGYVVDARSIPKVRRAGLPETLRIQAGEDQPDDTEVWLLNTARGAIDDELASYVAETCRPRPASPARREQRAPLARARAQAAALSSGTCVIWNWAFMPGFWNQPSVMPFNNCYNYAMNYRSNSFAQPGRISGHPFTTMSCADVGAAAVRDGCPSECSGVSKLVALVIWPGFDFHWYRNTSDGFWSHKIGPTQATNQDNLGQVISETTTPEFCARGPYTQFCGFMFPPLFLSVL